MRVQTNSTSQSLIQLIGPQRYSLLSREDRQFRMSLQNLGTSNVYIDYDTPATTEEGYCVFPGNEIVLTKKNINKIFFLSEETNDNVRILIE